MFSFFRFHLVSSLPANCQQHHGKPRISKLLLAAHGLQHLHSHSLGGEHANLLWGFQHSSVLLVLLVNDLKRFREIMTFELFWISWLSKKSCYRAVSCGVKKEPVTRRVQLLCDLFAVIQVFLDLHKGFANQLLQGWWEATRDEFFTRYLSSLHIFLSANTPWHNSYHIEAALHSSCAPVLARATMIPQNNDFIGPTDGTKISLYVRHPFNLS